jgi:hypothetical protein
VLVVVQNLRLNVFLVLVATCGVFPPSSTKGRRRNGNGVEAVGEAGLDNDTRLGERRKRFLLLLFFLKGKKRKNCT